MLVHLRNRRNSFATKFRDFVALKRLVLLGFWILIIIRISAGEKIFDAAFILD
jgi:hypothetical protein